MRIVVYEGIECLLRQKGLDIRLDRSLRAKFTVSKA